jgi:hypothetical protein
MHLPPESHPEGLGSPRPAPGGGAPPHRRGCPVAPHYQCLVCSGLFVSGMWQWLYAAQAMGHCTGSQTSLLFVMHPSFRSCHALIIYTSTHNTCVEADREAHGWRHARARSVQRQLGDGTPNGVDALWHIVDCWALPARLPSTTLSQRHWRAWTSSMMEWVDTRTECAMRVASTLTRSPSPPTRSPSVRQIAFTRRSGQFFSMLYTLPAQIGVPIALQDEVQSGQQTRWCTTVVWKAHRCGTARLYLGPAVPSTGPAAASGT